MKKILLTGCYRSGTEFASVLLNNHPQIISMMYVTNFMRYFYKRYSPVSKKNNYINLLKKAKRIIQERWNINLNITLIKKKLTKKNINYGIIYELIIQEILKKKKINTKKIKFFLEKNQLAWRQIPSFLKMIKNSKAIIIIRDPRSVMLSFKKYTYNPPPAYLGSIFNCYDVMQKSLKYKKKYKNILIIKYEDLILKENRTLREIYKFLNLPTSKIYNNKKNFYDLTLNKKWKHNSTNKKKLFDGSNLCKWKKELTSEEISFCEHINASLMKKFGYKICTNFENFNKHNFKKFFLNNKKIMLHYKKWLFKKKGIQEFPNNPLNPKNWEENNKNV